MNHTCLNAPPRITQNPRLQRMRNGQACLRLIWGPCQVGLRAFFGEGCEDASTALHGPCSPVGYMRMSHPAGRPTESRLFVFAAGDIGVAASNDDGLTWEHLGVALDEPWHLSYPFVFSWKNEVMPRNGKFSTAIMMKQETCSHLFQVGGHVTPHWPAEFGERRMQLQL